MGDPVPFAAIPVRLMVLVLVQLNIVPETALGFVITILVIAVPEHLVWFVLVALTKGIGLTVTVTVVTDEQVPAVAVIVNVVVIGAVVLLVNVPEIVEPDPLLAIPARPATTVLVQLKVVPANAFGFVMLIFAIGVPVQTD